MRRRAWLAPALATVLPWGAAAGLAGCGFQMRRPPVMSIRRLALRDFDPRSPLAAEIRQGLPAGTEIVASSAQADAVLVALAEQRQRSIVASTAAGQVREVQLRLRFDYRVEGRDGRERVGPTQMLLTRDMSYNETAALGKELEESQLYREMQSDIALQVLRRLATLQP